MLDNQNFTKYLSRHEIEATVQDLAHQLNKDYEGKNVVLICVLKGGIIFAADLMRLLDKCDTEIEFVRLTGYGKTSSSTGTVTIVKDIQSDIAGKHVLIVEEIIDSGRTLKFLFDRLKKSDPASIEVVTLLDKTSKRMVEVPVKYIGRKVENHFLIGYGLDLEEKCRNMREIYSLKYLN